MICFDLMFPEALLTLSLKGAQIIVHPSNLVTPYVQEAMVTRSIENRVFTVTANRVGTEARRGDEVLAFKGNSQVIDPSGKVVLKLGNNEDLQIVTIIPEYADNKMFTDLNDIITERREDLYFK